MHEVEIDPKQRLGGIKQLVTNKPNHQQRLCNLTLQSFNKTPLYKLESYIWKIQWRPFIARFIIANIL